jgi:tripartite-type tricarboxylate transporter receptor subunit TctC
MVFSELPLGRAEGPSWELAAYVPTAGEPPENQSDTWSAHGVDCAVPSGVAHEDIMKFPRRKFLHLAAGAAALPAVSRIAMAQVYPSHPITMIVPFPAGGPADLIGRVLAERMKSTLKQPIVVENVGGADGNSGIGRVARARPDGYTIGLGHSSTNMLNGAFYSLPYDVLNDFAPISSLLKNTGILYAKKTLPPNNLKELLVWLKANPNKATAATYTSSIKLLFAYLQKETGTQFALVPYRGGAPAMQDLIGGQIDLLYTAPAPNDLTLVRSGTVKAYAVFSGARLPLAPEIPTIHEMGWPSLSFSGWFGLFAPKGTPTDIIRELNAAAVQALADPAAQSRFIELGYELFPRDQQTPEAFGALVKADADKWWPIIKELGIKAQ